LESQIFRFGREIITTKTSIYLCIKLNYTLPNIKICDSSLNSTTLYLQVGGKIILNAEGPIQWNSMDGGGNAVKLMNWSPKSLDLGVHNTN